MHFVMRRPCLQPKNASLCGQRAPIFTAANRLSIKLRNPRHGRGRGQNVQVFAQEEKADEALQAADNQPSSALDQKLEVASKEPVKSPKLDEAPTEELQKPNYPAWIVSLLVVIGTFYTVVFYAGTGFFYLLAKKVDFRRKDFVPYSETLRLRKLQAQENTQKFETDAVSAPPLSNAPENLSQQAGSEATEDSSAESSIVDNDSPV